jgi:hypothetical protein
MALSPSGNEVENTWFLSVRSCVPWSRGTYAHTDMRILVQWPSVGVFIHE